MSNHLQRHMNTCAFNVTKDQEAVFAEIKNVCLTNLLFDIFKKNVYLIYLCIVEHDN